MFISHAPPSLIKSSEYSFANVISWFHRPERKIIYKNWHLNRSNKCCFGFFMWLIQETDKCITTGRNCTLISNYCRLCKWRVKNSKKKGKKQISSYVTASGELAGAQESRTIKLRKLERRCVLLRNVCSALCWLQSEQQPEFNPDFT